MPTATRLTAHSVLMVDHWRYDPSSPFQIASAQTLARRQWPDSDLIVIDEACADVRVGQQDQIRQAHDRLSATPFSDGLGSFFQSRLRIEHARAHRVRRAVVPMRVFLQKVNMRGAATARRRMDGQGTAERGMEIIGDVVSEWKKFVKRPQGLSFSARRLRTAKRWPDSSTRRGDGRLASPRTP